MSPCAAPRYRCLTAQRVCLFKVYHGMGVALSLHCWLRGHLNIIKGVLCMTAGRASSAPVTELTAHHEEARMECCVHPDGNNHEQAAEHKTSILAEGGWWQILLSSEMQARNIFPRLPVTCTSPHLSST